MAKPINVRWQYHNIAGPHYFWVVVAAKGDYIDLGRGSWAHIGQCNGTVTRQGGASSPYNDSYRLEYDAAADKLTWYIGDRGTVYADLLNPDAPVSYRKDVSGAPIAIVVNTWVGFGDNYQLEKGSYTVFPSNDTDTLQLVADLKAEFPWDNLNALANHVNESKGFDVCGKNFE